MRQFVESLRRLYSQNLITAKKLTSLLSNKKLTQNEVDYILQKD